MRESLGEKPKGEMKLKAVAFFNLGRMSVPSPVGGAPHSRGVSFSLRDEAHPERTRWDPKDGELCPDRTKPEETLVEVRSGSDVQIDRQIRV